MINKKTFFFLSLFLLFSLNAVAADTINKGDLLDLQQCIRIALKYHPGINAAASSVKVTDSRIGQARAGYFPQVTFQSNYQRIGPVQGSLLHPNPYDQYSNTLNLNQTLFDFGKTWTSVDIQQLSKASAEADLQDVTGQIILGVRQAYYGYLRAKMSLDVAQETVNQFQQHYEKARAFFETGKTSKIDVTSAEVNLSNAGINLLKADNSLRIARVTLNNAMGITNPPDYTIQNDLTYLPAEVSLEGSIIKAYENRPDIVSLTHKKEGLEKTIDLNKKGYLPVLSGNATYGYTGEELSTNDKTKSWYIGVTLTFPLFTGLSTKYQVEEARANLEIIKANEDSLKQKVYLEVESAYLYVREAGQRINAGKIIVRQAEETLELAQGRYATGVGSSLEITDALITQNNAKMTYITALTDFFTAQANLDKAMGVKP